VVEEIKEDHKEDILTVRAVVVHLLELKVVTQLLNNNDNKEDILHLNNNRELLLSNNLNNNNPVEDIQVEVDGVVKVVLLMDQAVEFKIKDILPHNNNREALHLNNNNNQE